MRYASAPSRVMSILVLSGEILAFIAYALKSILSGLSAVTGDW